MLRAQDIRRSAAQSESTMLGRMAACASKTEGDDNNLEDACEHGTTAKRRTNYSASPAKELEVPDTPTLLRNKWACITPCL